MALYLIKSQSQFMTELRRSYSCSKWLDLQMSECASNPPHFWRNDGFFLRPERSLMNVIRATLKLPDWKQKILYQHNVFWGVHLYGLYELDYTSSFSIRKCSTSFILKGHLEPCENILLAWRESFSVRREFHTAWVGVCPFRKHLLCTTLCFICKPKDRILLSRHDCVWETYG